MKTFFFFASRSFFLLLLFAGGLLSACSQEEPVKKVDLSQRRQIQTRTEPDSLTYACLPQYSHRVSFSRHHLLVEYIARKTDLPLRQVFPDTFEEHVKMVGAGKIDISFSNPLVYTRIADRYQASAFARAVEKNGQPTFRGQIICRADNKTIETIQDCRNKRWMAVDPSSAGGYLFVLDHFMKNGIQKSDFRSISFAPGPGGKQEKVVQAVYLGECDIGSIREGTLDLVKDRVDLSAISIIDHTMQYPGWVYAAGKDLEPGVVEKIKKALIELDIENLSQAEILKQAHFRGFVPALDSDFDSIRDLVSQVGEQPGE